MTLFFIFAVVFYMFVGIIYPPIQVLKLQAAIKYGEEDLQGAKVKHNSIKLITNFFVTETVIHICQTLIVY